MKALAFTLFLFFFFFGESSRAVLSDRESQGVGFGYKMLSVGDYLQFLNAVAQEDRHYLYCLELGEDPEVAPIYREGTLGHFFYTTRAGAESLPVTYISKENQMRYVNWYDQGALKEIPFEEVDHYTERGVYDLEDYDQGEANAFSSLEENGFLEKGALFLDDEEQDIGELGGNQNPIYFKVVLKGDNATNDDSFLDPESNIIFQSCTDQGGTPSFLKQNSRLAEGVMGLAVLAGGIYYGSKRCWNLSSENGMGVSPRNSFPSGSSNLLETLSESSQSAQVGTEKGASEIKSPFLAESVSSQKSPSEKSLIFGSREVRTFSNDNRAWDPTLLPHQDPIGFANYAQDQSIIKGTQPDEKYIWERFSRIYRAFDEKQKKEVLFENNIFETIRSNSNVTVTLPWNLKCYQSYQPLRDQFINSLQKLTYKQKEGIEESSFFLLPEFLSFHLNNFSLFEEDSQKKDQYQKEVSKKVFIYKQLILFYQEFLIHYNNFLISLKENDKKNAVRDDFLAQVIWRTTHFLQLLSQEKLSLEEKDCLIDLYQRYYGLFMLSSQMEEEKFFNELFNLKIKLSCIENLEFKNESLRSLVPSRSTLLYDTIPTSKTNKTTETIETIKENSSDSLSFPASL